MWYYNATFCAHQERTRKTIFWALVLGHFVVLGQPNLPTCRDGHRSIMHVVILCVLGLFAIQCQALLFPSVLRKYHTQSMYAHTTNTHLHTTDPETFLRFSTDAIQNMKSISDCSCFRVSIKDGGCSGMSYLVEPANISEKLPDDKLELHSGLTCLIDSFSQTYLEGINIGYRVAADPEHTGFTFENPNASSSW